MGKKTIDLSTCTDEEYKEYIRETTRKWYGHSGYSNKVDEDKAVVLLCIWCFVVLIFGIILIAVL